MTATNNSNYLLPVFSFFNVLLFISLVFVFYKTN